MTSPEIASRQGDLDSFFPWLLFLPGKGKANADLDKMIAMSMRDIASDEDVSDTEDPDLLVRGFRSIWSA